MKRKGADYHHGDLRRALVEATIRLVEAHGTDGFTLRAAAKLAGVSDGAPYHHFADKEALLAAVAVEGYELLYAEMRASAERQRGDARKKGRAMSVAYVLFAARHPARFRLMFGPLVHARRRHPELAQAADRMSALMRRVLVEGLREAGGRAPSADRLVGAWALAHGLSVLAIDGYLGADASDPRRLARLAQGALGSMSSTMRRGHQAERAPQSGHRLRSLTASVPAPRQRLASRQPTR